MGKENPSDFGGGCGFEVFGKTAASAAPGERAFNNPSSWQKLEALDAFGSFDDLDGPWTAICERIEELVALVDPVGEDVAQTGKFASDHFQQRDGAMAVLNVGGM